MGKEKGGRLKEDGNTDSGRGGSREREARGRRANMC